MNKTLRVLNVEDSARDAALLTRYLAQAGYAPVCERVETAETMKSALETAVWDVILCDYSLPHFNALSALALLKEMDLDIPLIIISGAVGEAVAVEAMRAGAHDYLMKDNLARLAPTIERELHEVEQHRSQRRAEAELRQSEARYRRLIDTAHEGIWIADAEARLTYANQRLAEMLGYTIEEMVGRSAFAIVDQDTRAEMKVEWQRRLEGIEEQYDLRLRRKDGSVLWVILSATAIRDEQGQVTGGLAMLTDITERKKMEEQLRQAHKMEAIGTLAGGIAHDFNNILGAIMGYSELAKTEVPDHGSAHAHLEQVLIASARAADLVRQILAFSRQEEPDWAAFQLQPIIDETLKLLRASLPSTVEIRQNIDIATPSVIGDSTQIQQMIMNLCVNAGQAMKEHGGVLEIRLDSIDLDGINIDPNFISANPELKEATYIRLAVVDTGSGMDRATQERIFDPFFTTKAPGEGTGLGLAVVHGVVKNHGGAITVFSEPGTGSTFNVYLPVYCGESSAAVQKSISLPQGNGEHILFVDDEKSLVSLAKPMLEHLGYRVTTKTDGVEALGAFRAHPEDFDLVITDQTMPRMNGSDLVTALLDIRPQLPVILATGYSTAMSAEKAKALGTREFLHKPMTMEALAGAIQRALGPQQKKVNQ